IDIGRGLLAENQREQKESHNAETIPRHPSLTSIQLKYRIADQFFRANKEVSMTYRWFGALVLASLVVAPVVAQTRTSSVPAPAAKKWTAPRTPWGDPDLQGAYDNTSENGTPLERPEIFEGRKLEDIKGQELLKIKQDAQKRTVENFGGPLHAPEGWWQ